MDKNKIILSIAILIVGIIIGGSIFASQVIKQQSIERQQQINLNEERKIEQAKTDKEQEIENFDNTLKCNALLKELKQRWNNVVGIYYDSLRNTCIVKYLKNGEVEEAPIEDMQDTE